MFFSQEWHHVDWFRLEGPKTTSLDSVGVLGIEEMSALCLVLRSENQLGQRVDDNCHALRREEIPRKVVDLVGGGFRSKSYPSKHAPRPAGSFMQPTQLRNTIHHPHLTLEGDVSCNNNGFLAAEVRNVVHDLLRAWVCHCLAESLLALKVQNSSHAVLVVWGQLDNAELLQAE